MKIKEGFAKRNIAGSNIVVPVGSAAKAFNGMITLNESGAFFWDCLTKEITLDEAVAKVTAEYEVDAATARRDIEAFVQLLRENGLLEE